MRRPQFPQSPFHIPSDPGARNHVAGLSPEQRIAALEEALRAQRIATKAGIPSDADFPSTPPVGTRVLDTTNNRLYVRCTAAWKYATLT